MIETMTPEDRLAAVGRRLVGVRNPGPIMTGDEDLIVDFWTQKGTPPVLEALGITYNQLCNWRRSLGHHLLPFEPLDPDAPRLYVGLVVKQPDAILAGVGGRCGRCVTGYMSADQDGVFCLNCGRHPNGEAG